jgi:hypothetical protein
VHLTTLGAFKKINCQKVLSQWPHSRYVSFTKPRFGSLLSLPSPPVFLAHPVLIMCHPSAIIGIVSLASPPPKPASTHTLNLSRCCQCQPSRNASEECYHRRCQCRCPGRGLFAGRRRVYFAPHGRTPPQSGRPQGTGIYFGRRSIGIQLVSFPEYEQP